MDGKGRVSLPAEFRTELLRRSDRPAMLTNMLDCLALFARDDWETYEDRRAGGDAVGLGGDERVRTRFAGAYPDRGVPARAREARQGSDDRGRRRPHRDLGSRALRPGL